MRSILPSSILRAICVSLLGVLAQEKALGCILLGTAASAPMHTISRNFLIE